MSFYSSASDLELWEKIVRSDEAAFRELFNRYYSYLLTVAFRFVPDQDRVRDFVQEAFLELWNRRTLLQLTSSPKSYLRKITVNRCLNFLKANKRLDRLDDTAKNVLQDGQDQHLLLEQQEENARLHAAIQQLPDRCREIFLLSRFEELSHKEIATKLNISTKTIENQITRAMKLLRKSLLGLSSLMW